MKDFIHNAFGYYIVQEWYNKGEVIDTHVRTLFNKNVTKDTLTPYDAHNLYLHTSGRVAVLHAETGNVFYQDPGWCTLDNVDMLGKYTSTMMTDVVLFFIFFSKNTEMVPIIPDVDILRASSNSDIILTEGQKLFLASGTFSHNGNQVSGPTQIQVSSDKTVRAVTNCYGFIFK